MTDLSWPESVEEILGSDQTIALAYVTPARGVVITPVTNFAVFDREAGTVSSVNTSVGVPGKLDRIRRDPQVALAYHAREHGYSGRAEYVLVQGRATLSDPDPRYMDSIPDNFRRFVGGEPSGGPLWQWWLRAWHLRIAIEVAVERVIVWPDLSCAGAPTVHGAPLAPEPPLPQSAPAKGTGPRRSSARAARTSRRLRHALLGWVGADGFPMIVPVEVGAGERSGIALGVPPGLLPPGARRAGLTAHRFDPDNVGMRHRVHTGWLESAGTGPDRCLYAPHTQSWLHVPRSKLAYKLMAGFETRRGMAEARRLGFA